MRIFSKRSLKNLQNVHPDLVKVVTAALQLSAVDFAVVEGVRDLETQRKYVAKGVSKTMHSRHLLQPDGYGHAIDLYPYYDGSVQVEAPTSEWRKVAAAMKKAACDLGVSITWGGDWKNGWDKPHIQLER